MKIFKNNCNTTYNLGFLIISLIVIFLIFYIQNFSTFWGDEIYFSIYNIEENIFSCLFDSKYLQMHGAGYIGMFLSKFLSSGLPLKLNLHPSDFIHNEFGIIKGILTVITLLSICSISKMFNKSKGFLLSIYQ